MAASNLQASQLDDARLEYFNFLMRGNVRRVNYEEKEFYHPQDILSWMCLIQDGHNKRSNAERLLHQVYHEHSLEWRFQPIKYHRDISKQLLIFAILFHPRLDCGYMIHFFRKHGIEDSHLGMIDLSRTYDGVIADLSQESISLPKNFQQNEFAAVMGEFDRLRWAFYPATLSLNMEQAFAKGSCILPFCYSKPINEKGGTASVEMYGVQEDLVAPGLLQQALLSSRKEVPGFGWCYELAVKSYYPTWADIYRMESQAFKGMRDQEGVVKYLGEYHLVGSVAGNETRTSHIMLEYGELDLDEYLAETYPPILGKEILTFWESFFKVAHTIKGLHRLKYISGDGSEQYFKGWHGDIKPDNILRVRGEYMLADFGFTKFESSHETTTHMLGGTRTYGIQPAHAYVIGAPECDRKAREGTLTPHSHAIDTWSFACVLSALATWVVLGSQAYESYPKRRQLAISRLRRAQQPGSQMTLPSREDSFHDGYKVLSAVTEWHDYLRNSCRRVDTITPLILDLIDDDMLLAEPSARLSLPKLCDRLDGIVSLARDKHRRGVESGEFKEMTTDTLEALLKLDEDAPSVATPASKTGLLGTLSSSPVPDSEDPSGLRNGQRLAPPASRIRKSERFDKIVAAKTASRQVAIRDDLGKQITPNNAPAGGTIYESPEQHPADDPSMPSTGKNRAGLQPPPLIQVDNGGDVSFPVVDSPVPAQLDASSLPLSPSRRDEQVVNRHKPVASSKTSHKNVEGNMQYTPYRPQYQPGAGSRSTSLPLTPRTGTEQAAAPSPPTHGLDSLYTTTGVRSPSTTGSMTAAELSAENEKHYPPAYLLSQHGLSSPIHSSSMADDRHYPQMSEQEYVLSQQAHTSGELDGQSSQIRFLLSEPDLESTAIYKEYDRLKREWSSKKGAFHSFFKTRNVPEDMQLKRFITERDIIFVVDNAASMRTHWNKVRATLLGLAMKVGTLDEDGLDVVFTLGNSCDKSNVKGWDIRVQFEASMDQALSEMRHNDKTDMAATLLKIFDRYESLEKRQTLIILTDGQWAAGSKVKKDVENVIIKFIASVRTGLQGKKEERWFSMQFVSFGRHEQAIARMTEIDDNLDTEEDVVDHKPWDSEDVDDLILGSIMRDRDGNEATSPPPGGTYLRNQLADASHPNSHTLERKPSKLGKLSNMLRF